MKKRILATIMTLTLGAAMLTACGSEANETVTNETDIVVDTTDDADEEVSTTEEFSTDEISTDEVSTDVEDAENVTTEDVPTEEDAANEETTSEDTTTEEDTANAEADAE